MAESTQVAQSGRPKARDMYIGDATFEPCPGRYQSLRFSWLPSVHPGKCWTAY